VQLLLDVRLAHRRRAAARVGAANLFGVLGVARGLAPRLLAPLELGVHLVLLGDEGAALLQLALARLALLADDRLELCELGLGHLLGVVGVVGHE
jgi:hypothetical protein